MPYGMAVTASHNPAIYNGIKVFTAGGRDADADGNAPHRGGDCYRLSPADVKSVDYDDRAGRGPDRRGLPDERVSGQHPVRRGRGGDQERLRCASASIPMYGVSWSSLSMLLTTCRCDLEVIHDRHDTLFGGKLPAPNVETLKPLAALVLDRHCDLGHRRPTATPTGWASSTTRGSSSTRTSCWCCCTTIW